METIFKDIFEHGPALGINGRNKSITKERWNNEKTGLGSHDRIGAAAAIPTTKQFNGSGFSLHPVKHLEVILYDKSPDSGALTNFWMTLGKETEALTPLNNYISKLASGGWINSSDKPYNSFKVG